MSRALCATSTKVASRSGPVDARAHSGVLGDLVEGQARPAAQVRRAPLRLGSRRAQVPFGDRGVETGAGGDVVDEVDGRALVDDGDDVLHLALGGVDLADQVDGALWRGLAVVDHGV